MKSIKNKIYRCLGVIFSDKYLGELIRRKISISVLFYLIISFSIATVRSEERGEPKLIKEMVFETMEKLVNAENKVTILEERFYCKGAVRMFGKIMDNEEHPTEEELEQAKAFGEMLKGKFDL